jgi:hypothetical protein
MANVIFSKHGWLERHSMLLLLGIIIVVSIGGLVEITPLFFLETTIEKVGGMRPYTPLELEGRDIYIREGCYLCHSQMVRPLRDEVERYGHYSLAAESMYDHPFQWGSKRNGPDLLAQAEGRVRPRRPHASRRGQLTWRASALSTRTAGRKPPAMSGTASPSWTILCPAGGCGSSTGRSPLPSAIGC